MSLTSLLQTSEVRRRFREEFEKPTMEASPDCVAPPISDRPAHVGTAFDYLLRFRLRSLNPETVKDRRWVAEAAVQLLPADDQEIALVEKRDFRPATRYLSPTWKTYANCMR